MIDEKKILAYALKNAVEYNGKAQANSVLNSLFVEGLEKKDIKKIMPKILEVLKKVNNLSLEEQKKEFEKFEKIISHRKERTGLPELPNVPKTGVIMRCAPSASGALHILHAINASYSYNYVKKYGGKMIVRIEDTNPENIDPKAYNLIKKDIVFLFKGEAEVFIQSERMHLYYDYAEKLIQKDKAYVCTCTSEKFKSFVDFKEACPCRNNDTKENLFRWKKMLSKDGYKSGEAVLRFKSSVDNPNPALRDFPLARINLEPHPLVKKKYRVWPLMNLAVAVDDIEMKMTHLIRGKDHRDNAERQKLIFKVFNKQYPWCAFLGRYHFKDMELSTSKFRKAIEQGIYTGWDDPRLPTIQSLKKRGYKPEAFWKMAEHIGLSEVDKIMDKKEFFRILDGFNKD